MGACARSGRPSVWLGSFWMFCLSDNGSLVPGIAWEHEPELCLAVGAAGFELRVGVGCTARGNGCPGAIPAGEATGSVLLTVDSSLSIHAGSPCTELTKCWCDQSLHHSLTHVVAPSAGTRDPHDPLSIIHLNLSL